MVIRTEQSTLQMPTHQTALLLRLCRQQRRYAEYLLFGIFSEAGAPEIVHSAHGNQTEHFNPDSLKDVNDIEDTTPSPSKKDGRFEQTEIVSTASLSSKNSEGELEQAKPDDPSRYTPSSARESSQDQEEEMKARNSDPPSPLGKRKRPERAGRPNSIPSEDLSCVEYLMTPLSEDERVEWKGWAEIESEPVSTFLRPRCFHLTTSQALFDYILKQHGVKNIKVTELTGVTDEVLNDLPYVCQQSA